MSDLDTLTTKLQLLETNIEDYGIEVEKIHNVIRGLEFDKEKVVKRFSTLREILSPKINILQRQLEECLAAKTSYDKSTYIDLSVVEVTSYALCALISISNIVKEKWKD